MEGQVIHSADPPRGLGVRHGQILLQVLFYAIAASIEISLSTTLPAILNFNLDFEYIKTSTISLMVSAYLCGFIVAELFSPILCKRFGFKWPMVILMSLISAVTLNLPLLGKIFGPNGFIFCRVIQGICIGLLYSMPAEVISRWVPVKERTILGTSVYASPLVGSAITVFACAYLGETKHWSFIYMQLGYLTIIWVILMIIFGADSPEQYHGKISESELDYIVHNRGSVVVKKKMKIPWSQILKSMPFWAIVIAQIGAGWILVILATNIPFILSYNFDIQNQINTMSFTVTLITWILSFSISAIAQILINEGRTSIEQSRKIFNTIGSFIPAIIFLTLSLNITGNQCVGIALWVIISVSSIGTICGSKLNANDISTNFAPVVYGLATWIGAVFNLVSALSLSAHLFDGWAIVLTYSGILAIVTNLFYLKFGSGEEQDWNQYEDLDEEEIDWSKSTSRASVDEGKYLLFVKKQ